MPTSSDDREPPGRSPRPEAPTEASRFRRPERPAASGPERSTVEPTPVLEDDPVESSHGSNGAGLAPRDVRTVAEPLAALAAAFQANAEALRRSQEIQGELHRALERADRSEMVVQTTGALNETFRGLTVVQKALVQRVEESDRESRSGRLFLPIVVVVGLAVIGAALWLVLQYVDQWREQTAGNGDVATLLQQEYHKGLEQGRVEAETATKARLEGAAERVKATEAALAAAVAERDAKASAAQAATTEVEALRREVQSSRVDALKVKALEDEADRLRREAAGKDPEIERLRRELAAERQDTAALRRQMGDAALLRSAAKDGAPAPEAGPAEGTAPEAASPPAPEESGVSRDRRTLERVRTRLNDLLQAGAHGRADHLELLSAGGFATSRLVDVNVGRYNAAGRLLNSIKAKSLRVVVDHLRRTVEFVFSDGTLEHGETQTPFPGGTYSTVVAEGEAVSGWTSSGLAFISSK
jgi:hypothetical protein